jgi:hypothetical protein
MRESLSAVQDREARLEALRLLARRMAPVGRRARRWVLSLPASFYPKEGADRSEAEATVGLGLLSAGFKDEAQSAVSALKVYARKKGRPRLRSAVTALAVALDKKPPVPKKVLAEEASDAVGRAEGLARKGEWEKAREAARKAPTAEARFRAFVALADVDGGGAGDLAKALEALAPIRDRRDLAWPILRLVRRGAGAGVAEEQLAHEAGTISGKALRAWAHLALLRAKLGQSKQVEGEPPVAVEGGTVASWLAGLELARHNTRLDKGWAGNVGKWEEPARSFGQMGVALGLQK